jgi:peptidoglycan/xylan/chitin deacetylase (PgdA/CDA1 family)
MKSAIGMRFMAVAAAAAVLMGCRPAVRWRVPGPGSRIYIPVFVLHRVIPDEKSEYVVSPRRFEWLLTELNRAGFTPISIIDLENALLHNGPLPPRPAMLTFDDAYFDSHAYAFPLMLKYGWTATFFVPTGEISESPDHRVIWGHGPVPAGMTWDELHELQRAGMSFGSHGVRHLNLETLHGKSLFGELSKSRKTLENRLGVPVRTLSYPGGRENEEDLKAASEAGYVLGFRSSGGVVELGTHDFMELPRVHVPGRANAQELVASVPPNEWR